MTISAWRITRRARAAGAFGGEGAWLFGGRWNSPGAAVVYASDTLALAALETLVHINPQIHLDHVCFEIRFHAGLAETLDSPPAGWGRMPPPPETQRLGDAWIARGRSAVLSTPSVLVPSQRNFLLNPAHADFARIAIGPMRPFPFDPSLKTHASR